MDFNFKPTREFAQELDRSDDLAAYREQFLHPRMDNGQQAIYLCGNSLGLQPVRTRSAIDRVLKEWSELGIEGWFNSESNWVEAHEELNRWTAKLVGARPEEVAVMNTLTVNLHFMMVSFYRPTIERFKILIEGHAFPSDQYAVKSQIRFHGYSVEDALIELHPRPGEETLRMEDIERCIEQEGDSVALIMLGGVSYYTGQVLDMQRITELGHSYGCMVGFDLAHGAGNIPLRLHDWGVDWAAWCSYKYINAGPGAIAACFIHERHHSDRTLPRFEGWWGNLLETRFEMKPDYEPTLSAQGWVVSTAPMLQFSALHASTQMFDEVGGMERLREKSVRLTGFLEFLLNQCDSDRFQIITPSDPEQRGCQLSLFVHDRGKQLFDTLVSEGVICDWREPNVIRLAPTPLYNSFEDVYRFGEIFKEFIGQ